MKRFLVVLALFLSTMVLASCFAESPTLDDLLAQRNELDEQIARVEENEIISKAIETLVEHWKNEEYSGANNFSENGYLEIKWTRVVYFNEEINIENADAFQNMNCFVEFFLLSDYFGTEPYYSHIGKDECVTFMKDGSFIVTSNPLDLYRMRYYSTDFEPIIKSISDRGSDFNQVFYLVE